ncbi:MAG: 50S ribosomal protein L10 [Deltaproteobacteria bacterium]|nr:50S ribosomal protein L10 [Deltaproteobacteria bacterium]
MNRKEKSEEIVALQQMLAKATTAVVSDYKGLTVAEMGVLRRELRQVAGEYRVAKNTLIELAIEGSPYLSLKDLLTGQNGLVIGYGDAVGLAKVVSRYAKENSKFTIKGGVTDGQFLPATGVETLSQLPTFEVLRAQLLGTLLQPATKVVSVLSAPASKLARVLDARKSQLDG